VILALAKRFGQMPDTIEAQMSEYWINRALVEMEAEYLDHERRMRR